MSHRYRSRQSPARATGTPVSWLWWQWTAAGGALATLVLWAFWGVTTCGFTGFDDAIYVTDNPPVLAGLTAASIHWAWTTGYATNWHPLTWLSLMLDTELFGTQPLGYHAMNLALHLAATLILLWALVQLTGARWRALLVAALFAVHPLRVESVAWIAERKDVLSACLGFLCLGCYARYARLRQRGWYGAAVVLFVVGLLAKQMFVTLPCLLLVLDYWPLRRLEAAAVRGLWAGWPASPAAAPAWQAVGRLVREKIPFFLLAAGFSAAAWLAQARGGATTMELVPWSLRLATALIAYVRYLVHTFWPTHLAAFYPYPAAWPAWQVAGAVLLLAAISGWALRQWQRQPALLVGWLWFLGTAVPVIGLIQIGRQSLADRYTYLPAIGLLVALVWGLPPAWLAAPRARRLAALAAGVVLGGLCLATQRQVTYWHDGVTLFRHAVAVVAPAGPAAPGRDNSWFLWYNLGTALAEHGQQPEAIAALTRSLELRPAQSAAHTNLALLLAAQGDAASAEAHLRQAISLDDNVQAYNGLANLLARAGKLEDAAPLYAAAIARAPEQATAYANFGLLRLQQGQPQAAIPLLQMALRLNPGQRQATLNLGAACLAAGELPAAESAFRQALVLAPQAVMAHVGLADVLQRTGRLAEARAQAQAAQALAPELPAVQRLQAELDVR